MKAKYSNSTKLLIASWVIYTSLYLCRVNISLAIPLIQKDLSISFEKIGEVISVFLLTYAIGQFINGYMSTVVKYHYLLIICTLGTSCLNILFSLANGYLEIFIIWCLNGYFQSIAWPTLVGLISKRYITSTDKAFSIFNTSWALGHLIAWLFVGSLLNYYSWRKTFTLCAIITLIINLLAINSLANIAGFESKEEDNSVKIKSPKSVKNKLITLIAIIYLIANSIRYCLIYYLPSYVYLKEHSVLLMTLISCLIPLIGSIGILLTGYKFSKTKIYRKLLFMLVFTIALMFSLILLPYAYDINLLIGMIAISLISLSTYAITSEMVTNVPITLFKKYSSSLISGFINSVGTLGSIIITYASSLIIEKYSFIKVFEFWGLLCLFQTAILAKVSLEMRTQD